MGTVQLYEYNHILLIRSVFFFYGNKADDALSEQIANDIQYHWNEANAKVMLHNKWWQVEFSIDGYYKPDMAPEEVWYNTDPSYNYFRIEATSPTHISFVDGVGSNTGYFKLDNLLQTSTTAAHEYGHTLGLKHPEELDIRGAESPGIMYPRGTICDPHFQYDHSKSPGETGGTLNPHYRKVLQTDVDDLKLHKLRFDKNGFAVLGEFTSIYHPFYTAEEI
ncbi:MAG: peptidase M10 [Chitinophagaceae bacterium]|nr:peptidase M10 [Chitinophagaceae bacterium]